jgi:hypothetical protein
MASAPPVTELATLRLKPDIDVYGLESSIWKDILQTISVQAGFTSLTWGLKVEDSRVLILCISIPPFCNYGPSRIYKTHEIKIGKPFKRIRISKPPLSMKASGRRYSRLLRMRKPTISTLPQPSSHTFQSWRLAHFIV